MKKELVFTTILVLLLLTIQLASASVIISQPHEEYNVGDLLEINIKLNQEQGVLKISLVCTNEEIFYAEYIEAPDQKTISPILKLNNHQGNCYIKAEIKDAQTKTQTFQISNNIDLTIDLNKETFFPTDKIKIQGTANKENFNSFNGTLDLYLDEIFLKQIEIINSEFNEELSLPSKIKAQSYQLRLNATDDENLNTGELTKTITVLQIPSKLELIIKNNTKAGENLTILAILKDQNNNTMDNALSLILDSPYQTGIVKKQISSNNEEIIYLSQDSPIGDWKLTIFYQDLEQTTHFFIDKNPSIKTTLFGNKLKIKNTGNTDFKEIIPIEIYDSEKNYIEDRVIELKQGEEIELQLSAPDGEYSIKIPGQEYPKTFLTGHVVEISEINGKKETSASSIFFILLIIAISIGGFFFFFSHSGIKSEINKVKNLFSEEVKNRKYVEVKLGKTEKDKKRIQDLFEKYVDKGIARKVIASPNVKGEKKQVTAFFIDMRGFTELTENKEEDIIPILNKYCKIVTDEIYAQGGVVNHIEADEVFALFNAIEDQKDHVYRAVKAAKAIMTKLKQTNITAGIGINTGQAIIGHIGSDKILKYTTIGDSINVAQKIEEKARNQIFVSKQVKDSIPSTEKLEKRTPISQKGRLIDVYEVMI